MNQGQLNLGVPCQWDFHSKDLKAKQDSRLASSTMRIISNWENNDKHNSGFDHHPQKLHRQRDRLANENRFMKVIETLLLADANW